MCLVLSPQTVAELTAAVETNKETVERYLQARYSSPLSPPLLQPPTLSIRLMREGSMVYLNFKTLLFLVGCEGGSV